MQGGQYAGLFDHVEDTLTFARFQCFDFEGMDKYPQVLEPLLFYVLHRANAAIYDPAQAAVFKLFVLDEAWRFMRDPTINAYITEALKTWRKQNAAMILATQSSEDLTRSAMLRVVVESCANKILLANPNLDRQAYRDLFGLNDTEIDLVMDLVPRQQLLLKRPDLSKVLNLFVDPEAFALYTNALPPIGTILICLSTPRGLTCVPVDVSLLAAPFVASAQPGAPAGVKDAPAPFASRVVAYGARDVVPAACPGAVHDDDRAPRRRADSRGHVRRQGALARQRHPELRLRQAGQAGLPDQPESAHVERHGLLVRADGGVRDGRACTRTSRCTSSPATRAAACRPRADRSSCPCSRSRSSVFRRSWPARM